MKLPKCCSLYLRNFGDGRKVDSSSQKGVDVSGPKIHYRVKLQDVSGLG